MSPLFLLACAADGTPQDVRAEVSAVVVTSVVVQWSTSAESSGWVEYGEGLETSRTAPGTEHKMVVRGLPSDSEVTLQVHSTAGGETWSSQQRVIHTGPLPNVLPSLGASGEMSGWELVPLVGPEWLTVVVDGEGRIVWYLRTGTGFRNYRSLPSRDGESVLHGAMVEDGDGSDAAILRVGWDGELLESVSVPRLDHDFLELPDGKLAAISQVSRTIDGEQYTAERIVEADGSGDLVEVWNAFDHFDPSDADLADTLQPMWTHANALDYSEAIDAYFLSLRNFDAILCIDRPTGDLLWTLGGPRSDFRFEGTPFSGQHQFEVLGDGEAIVVFDNGNVSDGSRVVEYELDLDQGVATELWTATQDPPAYDYVLGDVDRLASGDTRIVWSTAGRMEQLAVEGGATWALSCELGYAFGYSTRMDDLY